ncbi:PucR family transcriptional regulator [Zhihengliuella salsuginis]|uniref:Regulatory protein n=1 Tax=Zhihengliuella salsuginis TaxID=578222 RepID=A0ABQ3GJ69_9MICC|nr:PucR family transcriptional regulator ligand-binding domain-containing protein [Zhihengliuella salsuginis]GHD05710.1 putative regulatory protein [Zhihengliuella salsuginis]
MSVLPEGSGSAGRLTIASVLEQEEIRAGAPEVLAGGGRLDDDVRWVHVADSAAIGGLLEGGELVLTTGQAFRHSAEATRTFLDDLGAAGAAGVVIELVDARAEPATEAIEHLRAAVVGRDLPVVLLTRKVRFVRVTQVAHRALVGEQLARVERARHVHEVFTQLSLESASEQRIVDQTAILLDSPVVLEDVAHRVLAFHGEDSVGLLHDWVRRARGVGYLETTGRRGGADDWLQAPVGVRGRRWGRLVVTSPLSDDDEASQVLERAGQALTLARMAGRDERELLYQAQSGLIHELRHSRTLGEPEARTRAAALGLADAPYYLPAVIRLDRRADEDPTGLQLRERALLEELTLVVRRARRSVLVAGMDSGSLGLLLPVPARQLEDGLVEDLCARLTAARHGGEQEPDWSVGVAPSRPGLVEAAAGLDEAVQVAEIAGTLETRRQPFFRFGDLRLRGLMSIMQADPRVAAFAEAELAGLTRDDDAAGLDLLELYLAHGGNKSALARTGFLSRPALYARLAKLQDKLGVSLEDAESRTALHVAVLWHRLREADAAAS